MTLLRARVVIIGLIGVVIALFAGGIFDRLTWSLALAAIVPATVALLLINARWPFRLGGAVASIVLAVIAVVAIARGSAADVLDAFTAGFQRILSTDWPSPDRPDLIGTVAAGLAILVAIGCELARRPRLHLTPLVPMLVAFLGALALNSPLGERLVWLIPLALLGILFAALHPSDSLDEQLTVLRGERRLLPLGLIAVAIAAALTVPIAFSNRADPRRNDPPERADALLDPIEATLALQQIDPPIELHRVEVDVDEDGAPARWRTAALDTYDGRRWAPDLTLRPIGRRLAPPTSESVDATVVFLDDDLRLVPLPGAPVTVDAAIETDAARTVVRLSERPTDGTSVTVAALVEPVAIEVDPGAIGAREVDETVSGLTELASALAGDGDVVLLNQLRSIEQEMRTEFVLESDAPGGGLQRALIERFLRDTERGNPEQFATAFVLLARSLGVDARVATGFVASAENVDVEGDQATITITSADAAVWPEVRFGDEWVAFDPVPAAEVSDATPPPQEPQTQTPAAPQPPIAPPPETGDDPIVTDADDDDAGAAALSTVVLWVLRVAAWVGALLLPLLIVIVVILAIKWRRRRRRLSGTPQERIRGAWAVAADRLIDAGQDIAPSETNDEIADAGVERVADADRELGRLATLASAATFGEPKRPDLLADDASSCLDHVESSMAGSLSFWSRARWRLSVRSLTQRRRTGL
jgi:transglutaminase-like putative cysteine protease